MTDFAPPEGTDFSPSVRLKIGEREADGIVRETIEVAGSQGTRHRIEALVTGINLRDFEGTQVDEAGFVQLPIEVTFFNGDGIAITRTSTLQIQIAELISIGFENRTGFRINLDAGVRTPTLIVDFTNLPIEFQQRFDSGGDFETVRATVNVTAEAFFRNEIDGLARLALEKHFGGAANIPSTVDENSAVIQEGDQAIGIAVFASRDVADGTPPDQAKGARVFQQQFVNRELQKPFLDFDGFLENLLQFSDGEAFVEGGLRANLFASVRVVNGTSTVRVSSPDGSLGFPNVTTLEQTTLNAGNRTQIAGRRSGPATLLIESVDEDLRFELDTFVAPGAIPLIRSGTDELDEDDFSPRPDATVEERTVSLGFVRGESGVDPRVATILQQLSGENDAAFNLSQGDGDAVTTGIHRVTIDWGDGASDDVVLRPVLPGIDDTTGSSASVQHTFSAEFLRELERTRTLVNRELRTFGAITIRVDEITEGGELIRQGDVRRLNYFGQRVVPITFGPDANDADTQTIRSEIRNSFVEELPGSSSAPRELSQIRKEIVGRNIDGFRFSSGRLANEAFFDFTVDLGDGRIFRVLRDQTDADQVFGIFVRPFARLFRNAEATGEPERIRLDGSTIEFSDSQTFAPLVGFDEVGHYEIKVSQPAGLVIDGLSEPTEELVGFTDLVVLPEVDVEINADGSLSGTIASPVTSRRVLGDTRLRVSAIDSPNGVPPIEVSLADQDGFELTQAFVQEFLVAGRRLQIDVLYRDGTASENSQQIVTRVFTPNPKQDIEDITNFVVDGDPIQLNPLIVSFQLAPATVARAEAATNELPFRLTVSPGGGLNDIVLVRNDDTADGTFDVEGSDVSVPFFADGTITLMDGVFGTGLTEYSNPGTHTFRVFSECSFGSTEIRIADIPPSVVDPPEIESDLFGNITITGRIDAQQPVRINVDAPSNDPNGLPTELFEETVDASGQAFEVGFNSGGVRAGDRLDFKFTELESGLQTTRIIQNVRVQKRVFDVGLETEFDDQGAASLTLDLNELLRAALAGAEARFDAGSSDGGAPIEATRFSFAIQLGSEGATIPVEATAAVSNRGQAAFVRVGEESFSFGPDEIRDNRATLKIPVAFAQTGEVTVSISDEDECLTGSTPVNVPEIVNVPSDLSATLQPNGTTRILGKRPFGSNASIDLNIGGEDIVVEFDEEAAIFAFDIEGLPAGNTISASINGGPTVEATVEVKLGADHAQVPLRFVEDPDNPGERLVEVDFRKAAELLFAGVNEGERFTVSFDLGLVPIVISGSVSSSGERLIAAEIESFVGFVNLDEVFTVPAALIESAINPVDGQAEFRLDDVKLCIEGRTVFAVDESGRLIGLTASQRILVDVPAGGERTGTGSIQFATDNPANPDVSITSTGLNLIIGDVVVEEGDTRIVPAAVLEQNPEFTFEDAGGVGDKRIEFEIPDPNDENQTIRLASEVFFIGAFEPEPCEEHPSFPDGRVFGGDVTFVFADGNLTLSGDDENNGVAVFGDERGVVIQPIGGTTLNGSSEAVVIVEGVQTIDGELVVTTLGLGDDLLCLENLRITRTTDITSTPGDDVVLASGVDFDQLVRLDVGSGDDVIDLTGSTSDIGFQVSLGDGDDLFLGSDSPDFVSGGAGADTIYGAGGDDRLTGDAGADVQRGGDGNDTFFWNDGDGPDDNFGEGGGFDAFVMFGADGAADEVRLAPSDDEGETGDGTHPSPDFDVTTTLPTAFTIELSGVEVSDISGLGGNDQIDASAIPDGLLTALSLSGNNGDDVLQGSQGADFLVGGAGSDVLIGNQGNDDGFGEFFFGPDQDADEPGDDLFIWNNGDGADNFVGNEGADTFRFNGADGANDEVEVTPGGDDGDFEADGPLGASVDLIRSQPTPFTIETISIENFEVNGLGGDDRIDASALNSALLTSLILGGGTGNDELIGSAIDDTLNGDEGDDTLIGFLGADRQFGGSGNDLFVWNDGDGPDDNFGGSGDDTFRFNGADGADDELRIAPADDIGAVGDGTHSNPDFDLTRRAPSAFTIENGDIENAEINGLGGDDEFNVSSLSSGAVDLLLSGGTGDDTFVVADLINKVIAGGIGTDRLLAEGDGATIDFDAASDASISGISRIELDPNARNSLSLDPESVARVAGNDADLTIRADADDAIDIGDGWDTQRPQTIDELFHQVFVVEQRSIKVSSGRPFQNVESHSDVNADGRITPLDALLIINALRRARTSPVILDDNRPTDGISDFLFEDVNGDGLISPLDALQVINDLSR
ncbi:MAG: dockerin type I domain-containing protein [Planctomycetota bacterium]